MGEKTPPRSKGGQRAQANSQIEKTSLVASDQGGLFPTEERAACQGGRATAGGSNPIARSRNQRGGRSLTSALISAIRCALNPRPEGDEGEVLPQVARGGIGGAGPSEEGAATSNSSNAQVT